MPYRVFLSSTSIDLVPYREAVWGALSGTEFQLVGMESFDAIPMEPLRACRRAVARADLFIGIYAWRYGFIPPGSKISITEQELVEAQRRRKPSFCFVVDEKQAWSEDEEHRATGRPAQLLDDLKRRVSSELTIAKFTTPADLALKVFRSLQGWKPEPMTRERRRQLDLLEKVRNAWVRNYLEPATPKAGLLDLTYEEKRRAVASPWEGVRQELPDRPALEPGEPILELFLEHDRCLLLLGGPGSGKTITLLLLLQELSEIAERDPFAPIPVVLKLSTWQGQRLVAWIEGEINNERYRFNVGTWVKENQVLPLLDGLDEMEAERRPACVEAINTFLHEHGEPGMAVCCRTDQYRALLPHRLNLQSALELKPLADEQIEERLTASAPLQTALKEHSDLRELAKTPLMLDLMEKNYGDEGSAALTALLECPAEDRRRKILADYVQTMEGRPGSQRYTHARTRNGLAWLASRMQQHGTTQFQVEQLQPSWLSSPLQLWTYALLSRGLGGALLLLPFALAWGPALPAAGLAGGIAMGALEVGALRRLGREEESGLAKLLRRSLFRAPLSGLVVLALSILANVLRGGGGSPGDIIDPFAILAALLFTLVFGTRALAGGQDTRVVERFSFSWSWRGAGLGALVGLASGLLIVWKVRISADEPTNPLLLPVFALLGGLAGGLLAGLDGKVGVSRKPNLGLWLAMRSSRRLLAFTLPILTALIAIPFALMEGLKGAVIGLAGALVLSFWIVLWFTGMDFLQHFTLRFLLSTGGPMPFLWPRFLDHAADRGFLRKPGASYLFIHQELQEFFANLPSAPEPAAEEDPGF